MQTLFHFLVARLAERHGIAGNALFTNGTGNEAAYRKFTAIILNYFLWLFLSEKPTLTTNLQSIITSD